MARMATWNIMGKSHRTKDLQEAFKVFDLDYQVGAAPVFGHSNEGAEIKIPGRMLTYRMDNNMPFGIVSDRYPIIQNSQALNFIENVIQDADMELINGGHTSWGSFYLIGELPEIKVLNDSVRPNLIFQSSHDGTVPLKATVCMLRIACQNQFSRSFRESPATIRILHRGDTEEKLKVAAETLHGVYDYVQHYQDEAERLSKIKVTPKKFDQIVEGYFKIPEDASPIVEQRIQDRRDALRTAYNSDDNQNLKGSMWGVINAFTDYNTHREIKNHESLFLDTINPNGSVDDFCKYLEAV